ncbi:MAG: hypothetical protein GVY15_06920 [Bacteroidetes bacterium]|nr:hypothetical protein [Bacteroidota bacterium]
MNRPTAEISVFRSTAHPGATSARMVFADAFLTPLALCTLPVMLAVLVVALQRGSVGPLLWVGFPGAFGVAVALTLYYLQTTIAEVYVGDTMVALRTIFDCMGRKRRLRWRPVLEVRTNASLFILTLDDADYYLYKRAWPDADALKEALRQARERYELEYPT